MAGVHRWEAPAECRLGDTHAVLWHCLQWPALLLSRAQHLMASLNAAGQALKWCMVLMAVAVVGVSAWGLAESITATNDLVRGRDGNKLVAGPGLLLHACSASPSMSVPRQLQGHSSL